MAQLQTLWLMHSEGPAVDRRAVFRALSSLRWHTVVIQNCGRNGRLDKFLENIARVPAAWCKKAVACSVQESAILTVVAKGARATVTVAGAWVFLDEAALGKERNLRNCFFPLSSLFVFMKGSDLNDRSNSCSFFNCAHNTIHDPYSTSWSLLS